MFRRVYDYPAVIAGARRYKPRAYGELKPDGTWAGWLVFFTLDGRSAKAPPGPETTQSTWGALIDWAAGVTPIYIEGALTRALGVSRQQSWIDELDAAEYEALSDAEVLETSAAAERVAAEVDAAAAAAARSDAERIRRQRRVTEAAAAVNEAASATLDAEAHERAASSARADAAAATRRLRSIEAQAAPPSRTKVSVKTAAARKAKTTTRKTKAASKGSKKK